jgi:hypothetical protein
MTPEMDMILRLLSRNLELSQYDPEIQEREGWTPAWQAGYCYALRHVADEITRLRRALEASE